MRWLRWPWFKKKKNPWRDASRPFPWKEGDFIMAEKAYESYTTHFYLANKFSISTHVSFRELPLSAKEVWRKTAEDIARWTIVFDSSRGDLDG